MPRQTPRRRINGAYVQPLAVMAGAVFTPSIGAVPFGPYIRSIKRWQQALLDLKLEFLCINYG